MRTSVANIGHAVLPSALKSCTAIRDPLLGATIHGFLICSGWFVGLFTANTLMNMYCKLCHANGDVRQNSLAGETCRVAGDGDTKKLASFHAKQVQVDCLKSVRKVFDEMPKLDVVSWNTLIAEAAENSLYSEALRRVKDMGFSRIKPDSFTLSSILPIFAECIDNYKGMEIHGFPIRHAFDSDVFIGSSLIDMHANCTNVDYLCRVFDLLPNPDLISWNYVIAGLVQNGMFDKGLKLFHRMILVQIKLMPVSFSSIMPACAHLTTLHLGRQLHGYAIRGLFDMNVFVAILLVDMYLKYGNIHIAQQVFDSLP